MPILHHAASHRSCAVQIGWYKRFQNLIEEAVAKNHGQPAIIITHSMGGLVTYYFLKQVSDRLRFPCRPPERPSLMHSLS